MDAVTVTQKGHRSGSPPPTHSTLVLCHRARPPIKKHDYVNLCSSNDAPKILNHDQTLINTAESLSARTLQMAAGLAGPQGSPRAAGAEGGSMQRQMASAVEGRVKSPPAAARPTLRSTQRKQS